MKRVAQILKSSSRETDVVARYGGEEFAILMDETDGQGALQIAERVRQNIKDEVFQSDQGPFQCTMSLGVATYPDDGKKKELVIQELSIKIKRMESQLNRYLVANVGGGAVPYKNPKIVRSHSSKRKDR